MHRLPLKDGKGGRTVKKGMFVRILIVAAALALFIAPASLAAPPATTTMVVQAPIGLNLRSAANLAAPVVLVLLNGETVSVAGDPIWYQGIRWTWASVTRWGYTYEGYCASAYLANYPGYDEPIDGYTGSDGYKVTAPSGLRLRSGPGLIYYVKRIVPYGTILEPTGADTVWADGYEWIQLQYNGSTVWAAKAFLQHVP